MSKVMATQTELLRQIVQG
jgi:hypothetical protein